jgi:Bacterial lectin
MRGAVITLAFFLPAVVAACNAILGNDPVSLWEAEAGSGGSDGARDAGLLTDGTAGDSSASATDSGLVAEGATGDSSASDSGCEGGQILCDGGCIPWNGSANCGSCGNSCVDEICGVSIAASMQTQPSGWLFNGTATLSDGGVGADSGSAVLVPAGTISADGTVVYAHPIVADEFMMETNGPTAVGANGGGLGISGLTGYGVEFDIYDNMHCGDTNSNHVGIDLLPMCNASLDTTPTSLYASDVTSFLDLADAQWHSATITLQAGAFFVAIDGNALANQALTGWTPGVAYYYGFGAATGPNVGGYQAEVKDVNIVFPQPTCL